MAKKDVADMSVEQKLKTLYQLQTMLSEIDRIKILRGELPLEVQDLEDEIEGLTHRIGKYNEDVDGYKADIASKRAKINEAQQAINRYKEQLNDVKNNREYDMLSKEIEFQSLEVELQNKRIGEAQRAIDSRVVDITAARQQLDERRADLDVKKSELDEITAETKAEEEKLREKAKNLEQAIDPPPPHRLQAHPQELAQRSGHRLRAARRLRRLLQQDSAPAPARHPYAQENHCV